MKIAKFLAIQLLLFATCIAVSAQPPKKPALIKGPTIGVKAFFPDFPKVAFGMSFGNAKKVLEKAGIHPGTLKDYQNEIAWDGTFADMSGRATMFFKPDTGAWEIAVIAYAMEKQKNIFAKWRKKIEAKHGPSKEIQDDEYAVSHVWRFKDKTALELRMPKDESSPVVDIHWVKQ